MWFSSGGASIGEIILGLRPRVRARVVALFVCGFGGGAGGGGGRKHLSAKCVGCSLRVRRAQVFSTDTNTLNVTRVSLGAQRASKAKLILRAAHPLYGRLRARPVFGISDVALFAAPVGAMVQDCSQAAKSADARDKFFLSYVGQFDPCPGKALLGELPALAAAKASVAGTSSELAEMLSRATKCLPRGALREATVEPVHMLGRAGADVTVGLDEASLSMVLSEARATIIKAREASL